MKTEQLKTMVVGLGLAVSLLLNVSASANQVDQVKAFKTVLKAVRAAELPATAASLVEKAKPTEQEATAVSVIHAATAINPSAVPAVVGAISRVAPATAPVIAALAASLQSKMAGAILQAARSAAPSYAEKITLAVNNALQPQVALAASTLVAPTDPTRSELLRPMAPPTSVSTPPTQNSGTTNSTTPLVIQPQNRTPGNYSKP